MLPFVVFFTVLGIQSIQRGKRGAGGAPIFKIYQCEKMLVFFDRFLYSKNTL
ncbi:hypothetical protein D2M30_0458 [Bacillus amyloliquefaciens]|nr:hypothetical protein D2M30_0458 [Bacillus amyloliquefaciens]